MNFAILTLAILQLDGVSKESRCAEFTRGTETVVEALHALPADRVAGGWVVGDDVSGALARLAEVALHVGSAVEAGGARLAGRPRVARTARAADVLLVRRNYARGRKAKSNNQTFFSM